MCNGSSCSFSDALFGPISPPVVTPSHCVSNLSKTRRVITHRQQVDESNDEVQQLLEANMGTVEECIRAIESDMELPTLPIIRCKYKQMTYYFMTVVSVNLRHLR